MTFLKLVLTFLWCGLLPDITDASSLLHHQHHVNPTEEETLLRSTPRQQGNATTTTTNNTTLRLPTTRTMHASQLRDELQHWIIKAMIQHKFDQARRQVMIQNNRSFVTMEHDATTTSTTTTERISLRRTLLPQDFARFNELFRGAELHFDNIEIKRRIAFELKLKMENPYCKNISIDDIAMVVDQVNGRMVNVDIHIQGLHVTCFSDYSYRYGLFGNIRGSGNVDLYTKNNTAEFQLRIESPSSFQNAPPNNYIVTVADATFNIDNVKFHGKWVAGALNTFKDAVKGFLKEQLEKVAKTELSSLGTDFIMDSAEELSVTINKYLQPIPPNLLDPTLPQQEFLATTSNAANTLDLQNLEEGSIAQMVADLLARADQMLGQVVEDDTHPSGFDLGINGLMRRTILEPDGSLYFPMSRLPAFDAVLFESHDKISKTKVELLGMKIWGLDQFLFFDPISVIDKLTLKHFIYLRQLTAEVELEISIKPSDLPDAILRDADTDVDIRERVSVTVGVDHLNVVMNLFLAIDNQKLEAMELGSVLKKTNIFPCLSKILKGFEISGFDVVISNVREPVIDGFISKGIDHLFQETSKALFVAFEPTLLKSVSHIFQLTVRNMLNQEIETMLNEVSSSGSCDWDLGSQSPDSSLDFRDIFLTGPDAKALGGLGTEPYGNMISTAYGILQDRFLEEDNGKLGFNTWVVEPATTSQSGTPGTIDIDSEFVLTSNEPEEGASRALEGSLDLFKGLIDGKSKVAISGLQVNNINTVVTPLTALAPTRNGVVLTNAINVGSLGQPDLAAAARLKLLVEGPSALALDDEIEFIASVTSIGLLVDTFARINAKQFMEFPIQYIMDFNCWLSMIPDTVDGTDIMNIGLQNVLMQIKELLLGASIVSGSSAGIRVIPRALEIFTEKGAMSLLNERLESLLAEFLSSDLVNEMLENKVRDARAKCPSSSSFDPNFDGSSLGPAGPFVFSPQAVDTIIYSGMLLFQTLQVAVLKNHVQFGDSPSLVEQRLLDETRPLVDWQDLNASLGVGEFADDAFRIARDFLSGLNEEGELNLNAMITNLTADGALSMEFDDLSAQVGDLDILVQSVSISGLNSFENVALLTPKSPQVLSSNFSLAELDLALQLSFASNTTGEMQNVTLQYSLTGIEVSIDILAAFFVEKILPIELVSILFTSDLLPCFLAAAQQIAINTFVVSVSHFSVPAIQGLQSQTDASARQTLEALYQEFMDDVVDALPALTNTTLKQMANNFLDHYIASQECPKRAPESSGFVDFRDLLLRSEDAKALGGSGSGEFGSLGMWFEIDSDGSLPFNELVVNPATFSQSGQNGTLDFADQTLLSFTNPPFEEQDLLWDNLLSGRLNLSIDGLRLNGLNTFAPPMDLLLPTNESFTLTNQLNMGKASSELSVSATIHVLVEGDGDLWSPLALDGSLQVELSAKFVHLLADILARLNATSFLTLPFQYLFQVDCWLSLFPEPQGNQSDHDLWLSSFVLQVIDPFAKVSIASGSSPGLKVIPHAFNLFQEHGGMGIVNGRLGTIVSEVLQSDMTNSLIDNRLRDAHISCPLTSLNAGSPGPYPVAPLSISDMTLDTFLFGSSFMLHTFVLTVLENHNTTETAGQQSNYDFLGTPGLLDWTDLSTLGFGGSLDNLFEQARDFLGGVGENGDLNINSLIRQFSKDGIISLPLNDVSFPLGDLHLKMTSISLTGLDTFSHIDLVNPTSAQVLSNSFGLDSLSIQVNLLAEDENEDARQNMSLSFSMKDIEADLSLLAAFNLTDILDIKLGSLLYTIDLLPCLISTAEIIEISSLTFEVAEFGVPRVMGLKAETQAAMDLILERLYDQYDVASLLATFVNSTVKQLLNNYLQTFLSDTACPDRSSELGNELIAVGDLLDGTSEFAGDLFSLVRGFIDAEFLDPSESTGLSSLNDLVDTFTEGQSGSMGQVHFPGTIADIAVRKFRKIGIEWLNLAVADIRAKNLNTIEAPVMLLNQSELDSSVLENRLRFGALPSPFEAMANLLLSTSGDPLLSSMNELTMGLRLASVEVFAAIRAQIKFQELINFPLRNLMEFDCWFALFRAPELDENGARKRGQEAGLFIEEINVLVDSMEMFAFCSEGGAGCTTSSIPMLEEILSTYRDSGLTDLLKEQILLLVDSLASSSFLQTFLDRILADAADRCLADTQTSGTDIASYPVPPLPAFSQDMIDSLVFVMAFAFETAVVIVFEAHATYIDIEVDPLLAQKELDTSSESLINFQNFSASFGGWGDTALSQLRSYASDETEDGFGLNQILNIALLDEGGSFSIDLTEYTLIQDRFSIMLGNLTISGFDSISKVSVLEPIGPQTLMNELHLDKVEAELEVLVATEEAKIEGLIQIEMANVQALVAILIAIDYELLGNLELGHLLQSDQILQCLLTSVESISFPMLEVSAGDITRFEILGIENVDVVQAIKELTQVTLTHYKTNILDNFPYFVGQTLRSIVNNYFRHYLSERQEDECSNLLEQSRSLQLTDGFIDLRDLLRPPEEAVVLGAAGEEQYGDILHKLMTIINENILTIDPDTGLSKVNSLIVSTLTEAQSNVSGKLMFEGDVMSGGTRIQLGGLDLKVDFRVSDAYIDNLDTIGAPFSLLDPVMKNPFHLNNTATIGLGSSLMFGARVFLSVVGSGQEIVNTVDVSLSLDTVRLILEALLRMSKERFLRFPLSDLLSTDCLLSVLPAPKLDPRGVRLDGDEPSAGLVDLALSVAQMKLNVTCAGPCSDEMSKLAEFLSSPEASQSSTEVANDVLDYVTNLLGGDYLQIAIDRMIYKAHMRCPASPLFQPDADSISFESFTVEKQEESVKFLVMLAIASGCVISALLIVMVAVKTYVLIRHKRWIATLDRQELEMMLREQTDASSLERNMNHVSTSMYQSETIPKSVRIAMPFIILGNIGFFLSGHLSLGATVNIMATLAGDTLKIDNFFEFSIMKSTIQIWNAGGTELAIMLLIFSVIWPYTKQFITLALWFLPPRAVSISRRGKCLEWLDFLAKWSMVDIFTLILTVAGFRVSIQSPDVAFLPDGFYSIDLVVVPMWGLYANFIAQLISQISSHFIIHYHRKIQKLEMQRLVMADAVVKSSKTLPLDMEESSAMLDASPESHEGKADNENYKDRLCEHAFRRPHRSIGSLYARPSVHPILIFGSCATAILVLFGCIFPSFSIEILGFIGVVVESGQSFNEARYEHSVFTMMQIMREQADFTGRLADKVGLGSLSALLVFSVLIVPVAQACVLTYIWMVRMTQKTRRRLGSVVEILQAWQYSEVYLLSVVVTSWQLGPVSDFMINSYCNALDDFFAELVFYGILKEEDAQCFRVEANVESAAYLIAAGAVVLALLNTFVTKAVLQYFRDVENERTANAHYRESIDEESQSSSKVDSRAIARQIRPVPVLCTDKFRWFFVSDTPEATLRVINSAVVHEGDFLARSFGSGTRPDRDDDGGNPSDETQSLVSASERSKDIHLVETVEVALRGLRDPPGETMPDDEHADQVPDEIPMAAASIRRPHHTGLEFTIDTGSLYGYSEDNRSVSTMSASQSAAPSTRSKTPKTPPNTMGVASRSIGGGSKASSSYFLTPSHKLKQSQDQTSQDGDDPNSEI